MFRPVACLITLVLVSADWPSFRGEPKQTAAIAESLPDTLEVLWSRKTDNAIESTAVIVGGVVYVASYDGNVYAFDLKSGSQKWKATTGPVKAPLGFHDGRLFVGNDEGMVRALDPKDGSEKWKFEAGGEVASGFSFSGDDALVGCGDEHLYCIKRADGSLRWKFQVAGGPVMGTPVILPGKTFSAGCDSKLHAINLTDGKELATLDLGGQVGAAAAFAGDRLYFGTMTNQFLAIDPANMSVVWATPKRQPFYSSPAVSDSLVVVGCRDRKVYAFDRQTGKEQWSLTTGARVDSSPVIAGNRAYVGSHDGNLYVVDLATGKELQKIKLDGPVIASPAVADGRLVVGTEKGTVYCFGKP